MHTLTVKSLQFHAGHGLHDFEKNQGNRFEVDLVFTSDFTRAGQTDSISDTIDYSQVQKLLKNVFDGEPVNLIETLARKIGDTLMNAFPEVHELEVRVRKMNPPIEIKTEYVQISMQWHR